MVFKPHIIPPMAIPECTITPPLDSVSAPNEMSALRGVSIVWSLMTGTAARSRGKDRKTQLSFDSASESLRVCLDGSPSRLVTTISISLSARERPYDRLP